MTPKELARAEAKRHTGPLPIRTVCPVCLGGGSHEESFVIWESDGSVFATCHRARCEVNTVLVDGSLNVTPSMYDDARTDDSLRSARAFSDGGPLTDVDFAWLKEKCGEDSVLGRYSQINNMYLHSYPVWARDGKESGGLLMPMYDVNGERRGSIIKPYEENLPKSLTYKEPNYDGMSWYLTNKHMLEGSIIVVEDGLSAFSVMALMYRSTISLNGTLLNRERVEEIFRYKKIMYLCLDADATPKALKYAIMYGSRRPIKVIRLTKDFKNMTVDEMKTFFKENQL